MKQMMTEIFLAVFMTLSCFAGPTITYTYDKQHRLTSVDYSAAQTDAHVTYQYDAANNLDMYVAITDGQYLKSFLWYLSWLPSPTWSPHEFVEISWPAIWANVAAKS